MEIKKEMRFTDVNGLEINPFSYTLKIIEKSPDVKIHIGTDSQSENNLTKFITAIAYRYNKRGVHYIYSKTNSPKINNLWNRLFKETELSLSIAEKLKNKLNVSLEIDMDYNENENFFSNKLVPFAKGWANSLGYKVNIKPNEQIATSAADYHTR